MIVMNVSDSRSLAFTPSKGDNVCTLPLSHWILRKVDNYTLTKMQKKEDNILHKVAMPFGGRSQEEERQTNKQGEREREMSKDQNYTFKWSNDYW